MDCLIFTFATTLLCVMNKLGSNGPVCLSAQVLGHESSNSSHPVQFIVVVTASRSSTLNLVGGGSGSGGGIGE